MTAIEKTTSLQELQSALRVDTVLTSAQCRRRGWWEAAQAASLPTLTRTCRVRVTDPESGRDLEFMALEPEDLTRSPRELMHLAGLAEARTRVTLAEGEVWRLLGVRGAAVPGLSRHWPDAEIVQTLDASRRTDWAAEFDAGYSRRKLRAKVEAFARAGFTRLYWATSVHTRVATVMDEVTTVQRRGLLPRVVQVETRFVDFWSTREPYGGRPRCHKVMGLTARFGAAGGR